MAGGEGDAVSSESSSPSSFLFGSGGCLGDLRSRASALGRACEASGVASFIRPTIPSLRDGVEVVDGGFDDGVGDFCCMLGLLPILPSPLFTMGFAGLAGEASFELDIESSLSSDFLRRLAELVGSGLELDAALRKWFGVRLLPIRPIWAGVDFVAGDDLGSRSSSIEEVSSFKLGGFFFELRNVLSVY